MKRLVIILCIGLFISCKDSRISKQTLIGNWKSEKISLEITEDRVMRIENGKEIVYDNYSISNDTLKLFQKSNIELHLISLKEEKLIFNPVDAFKKDIQLIDQTVFTKTLKEKNVYEKAFFDKKLLEGVWAENTEENALFFVENDSITYVESLGNSYPLKLKKDTLYIHFDGFMYKGEVLKLSQDSLVYKGENEIIRLYRRKE
ncbi:hypothetical protein [uncultured Tenacibaculum sp.]|uniref:hypothetical protein n=1 Tax=uncultured Tenacibaculum sp. TaxID=174713 RepID=UPI00260E53B1|nr:hypothetical protein [uncultured Tenacibaculum sp.]